MQCVSLMGRGNGGNTRQAGEFSLICKAVLLGRH